MKPNASILKMYAVTPCHVGSGSSLGIVDLPIMRERHTNWPFIPSSGMKGALREHFDRHKENINNVSLIKDFANLTEQIFGSEKSEYAGSLSISDAKILAFPMRSNIAPFIWITCPSVLKRLNRDLKLVGKTNLDDLSLLDKLNEGTAFCWKGNISGQILLEDTVVTSNTNNDSPKENLLPFFTDAERLLVVHDTIFNYGVTDCTSIVAQIKIDQITGTTQDGSLRYQEELPADTIMYSVIFWGDSRDEALSLKAATIKNFIKDVIGTHIQIGGNETCGRGFFELRWEEIGR